MTMLVYSTGVEWVSEPTSRGHRWVAEVLGHWLIVYSEDHLFAGRWHVIAHANRTPSGAAPMLVAEGYERSQGSTKDVEMAKLRAIAVYTALTDRLSDASAAL